MLRFLLALFLALPLALAPVISARAHVGSEGCVTAISTGKHHSGHAQASGDAEQAHKVHHVPAPEQKRVAPPPCCITVCPGLADFSGQRSSPPVAITETSRFADESVAGRPVEPAEPPPRSRS